MRGRLLALVGCMVACGHPGSGKPVSDKKDAGRPAGDAAAGAPAIAPLALGMASLDGFGYRTRPGHPAFKTAREAESKGDWVAVAAACESALAADPTHLDAAYLLAVARAKQNQTESIATPLATAVAGDFGKWGQASLDQPALQRYLAMPSGQAWSDRVEHEREPFSAMLARSLLVTAHGDLYAFDQESTRWLRVTRTGGTIVGVLVVRSAGRLAYVTRERVPAVSAKGEKAVHGTRGTRIRVGMVDLATGRAHLAVELPGTGAIRLAHNKKLGRFVVRIGNAWSSVVDDQKLALEPVAATAHPQNLADLTDTSWLDVNGHTARITRLGIPNVGADWDDLSLASALRIGSSHRVITVPSPGLIQGNTLVWSADRTQLAFAAQLADTCKPGEPTAAAFVADAATGTVQEIERATGGIAVDWAADRKLAVAGDKGVSIVDLATHDAAPLPGADGLVLRRFKPKCAPPEPEEPEPEAPPPDDE